MATALDWYQAAIASSTANDAGRLCTDAEALGRLNRSFQRYYALWSAAANDGSLALQSFTFSGIPASVTLPTDVIDVDRVELTATGEKANVIPLVEKERFWHQPPAMFRQGLSLVTRGQTGDPVVGTVISVWLDDPPATLSALATTIDVRFPVRFHLLPILDLALYLDSKDEGRDPSGHAKLQAQFDAVEQGFSGLAPTGNTAKDSANNPKALT